VVFSVHMDEPRLSNITCKQDNTLVRATRHINTYAIYKFLRD